jgi:hypothetical protein
MALFGFRTATCGRAHGLGVLALTLSILTGCASQLHAVPVDPNVDFAAHVEHSGLVVDEMPGLSRAVLVPAGWHSMMGGPRFLLQAHDKTIAALWFPTPNHMIVRQSADPQSPLIGEIRAKWTEGAIHLTFEPANGPALQSTEFGRIDGRVVTAALSSQAQTVLDVRGTYRAQLRDSTGAPVGWLRVQISPYQAATRIYDGVLPASLNGPLATAAVALLDSDVDYIEGHALNVYQGN